MTKDAHKFFISWILEMVQIGGSNLPKSISAHLGSNLAKIYKKMGKTDIVDGLKESYRALKGNAEINKINENTYEIVNKYNKKFCPIGGSYSNPKNAKTVQETICTPFTIGFLNELDPRFNYNGVVEECIVDSNKKTCRYTLNLEEKKGNTKKKS